MHDTNLAQYQETAKQFLDSTQTEEVNVELLLIEYMIRAIQKISLH